MKLVALTPLALLLAFVAERDLATQYRAEHAVRVVTETGISLETTAMEMLRDGEPVENRGGFGGGSSEKRHSVVIDRWIECADGKPAKVRRSFETVEGETERDMRGETVSSTIDSEFSGVTLDIARDEDGDVSVEVSDGTAPDEELLAGHRPELCLDALLPEGPVADGGSWELGKEAVARALGLDLAAALYPRPSFGGPEGGREGRGGGGGRGGGRGGFGGGSADRLLAEADWTGTATLKEGVEEQGGKSCAVIALELKAEGDTDDGEGSSSSFEAKLEGRLYVSVDDHRPVSLEIEGQISTESDMEREREGSTIEIHRAAQGTFTYRVAVEDTAFEAE